MPPKVYGTPASPPFRSTVLTVKALGIDVDFEEVNLQAGDHFTPEFLKLNPLHTVPTLQDGDFAIWDSHAINAYLVERYGKDDSLYPKDPQKKAVINQRLYFDAGNLFPSFLQIVRPLIRELEKTVHKEAAATLVEGYGSLETLLERSTYVAGEELSIADFSLIATVTSSNIVVPIATNRFPKITAWISKMEALPYYVEANQKGLDVLSKLLRSRLA